MKELTETPKELANTVGCLLLNALGAIEVEIEQAEDKKFVKVKKFVEAAFETHQKLYHLLCTEGMGTKRATGSS